MAKKSNYTMYIIIAIVVVLGLVLFIFKDSIFGVKKTVPVVVSIPDPAQVKAQAQVLAQVLDQAKAQVLDPVQVPSLSQVKAQAQVLAQVLDQAKAQVLDQAKAQVLAPVLAPSLSQVKAQAQVLAQVLDQAKAQVLAPVLAPVQTQAQVSEMAIKTIAEVQLETKKMIQELAVECGGMDVPITKECYNIAKSKIPKIKQLLNLGLTFVNDSDLTEATKEEINETLNFINQFEPQLTDQLYENMIKGRTLEDIIQFVRGRMIRFK